MAEKANSRGHSTSTQAAELARDAAVGRLIITHLSSRYVGEACLLLLEQSRAIFPNTEMAGDFSHLIFDN